MINMKELRRFNGIMGKSLKKFMGNDMLSVNPPPIFFFYTPEIKL